MMRALTSASEVNGLCVCAGMCACVCIMHAHVMFMYALLPRFCSHADAFEFPSARASEHVCVRTRRHGCV